MKDTGLIFDDLILARKSILVQKPVNAIQAIDRVFEEMISVETALQHTENC